MSIPLGSAVEDVVSGFRGIVTSRCEYFNGCVQYGVQPTLAALNDDDKMPKVVYLDADRLLVDHDVIPLKPTNAEVGEEPSDERQSSSVFDEPSSHRPPGGPRRSDEPPR